MAARLRGNQSIRTNDGRRRHSACECFLHTTPAEQIRRFKDRLTNPLKRWKLSYEDFRNRSRSADYDAATEEMMDKASTKQAPWYLVPTNDKPYGRLAVFTILVDRLGKGLSLKTRPLDPRIAKRPNQLFDFP
jgi:polyphosphate kinase 2 (PPK2 family)